MSDERFKIQLLPIQLANQIAAGEVVERPASVVKELVENSLDAKATEIYIDIEKGGSRRIKVVDNGVGIPQDELKLALSRHATSKIKSLADLEAILSLGFRGEALASISSVSRLTLSSQTAEQSAGYQAFCEGRDMAVKVEPTAHPIGTTVDVEDLFFNTPARRKFLRTDKTEFGHIEETIKRIALAAPEVTFRLKHNGQTVRHYPRLQKGAEPLSRIARIVGNRFAEEAVYFSQSYGDLHLTGWASPGPVCRHQADIQYFYVNHRMMRDRLLNHAVRQAYGDSLPSDRQPSFVLFLSLPAKDVDVNVHPAKHEVRFHQSRQVHDFVLSTLMPLAEVNLLEQNLPDTAPAGLRQSPIQHEYRPPDPSRYLAMEQPSRAFFPRAENRHPLVKQVSARAEIKSTEQQQEQGSQWRPLSLLDNWLLVQKGSELGLVALHVIKEAAWIADLSQRVKQGLNGQPLLLPTHIELPDATRVLAQYQASLALLGVQLKAVRNNKYAVMQVPAILRHSPVERTLPELLACLQQASPEVPLEQRTDVLQWLAQQDTVPLDFTNAQKLWQQLVSQQTPPVHRISWQAALQETAHA